MNAARRWDGRERPSSSREKSGEEADSAWPGADVEPTFGGQRLGSGGCRPHGVLGLYCQGRLAWTASATMINLQIGTFTPDLQGIIADA